MAAAAGLMLASLRPAFYRATAREPVLRLARHVRRRGRVVALMYHEVLDDDCRLEAWTVVRRTEFVRQMTYLRRHFAVVTIEEAAEALRTGAAGPLAVVTFDDGYSGNLRVALPVVESLGIPITVFVATAAVVSQRLYWYDRVILTLQGQNASELDLRSSGLRRYSLPGTLAGERHWTAIQQILTELKELPPDRREHAVTAMDRTDGAGHLPLRPLTVDEVGRLSRSAHVTIGSHSHCHNRLVQLAPDALDRSLADSKALLERWTGRAVHAFSYPNGDTDAGVTDAVRRHGFSLAVATRGRAWAPADSLFEIPRLGVGRYDGLERFRSLVSGVGL